MMETLAQEEIENVSNASNENNWPKPFLDRIILHRSTLWQQRADNGNSIYPLQPPDPTGAAPAREDTARPQQSSLRFAFLAA
jgi:hypothetical protein